MYQDMRTGQVQQYQGDPNKGVQRVGPPLQRQPMPITNPNMPPGQMGPGRMGIGQFEQNQINPGRMGIGQFERNQQMPRLPNEGGYRPMPQLPNEGGYLPPGQIQNQPQMWGGQLPPGMQQLPYQLPQGTDPRMAVQTLANQKGPVPSGPIQGLLSKPPVR